MRIAIAGAGGVGSYLGVLLAPHGHDISLIDVGSHARALQISGVVVRSRERGELRAMLPTTTNPGAVGVVDVVLFAVKTYDNDVAIPSLTPLVGAATTIITLQNGIGNVEALAAAYGAECVLAGPMVGGGTRVGPGEIEHVLPVASEYIEIGGLVPSAAPRVNATAELLAQTGLEIRPVQDTARTLWSKLLAMSSLSAVGCLTRLKTADWRDHPGARGLYATLVRESAAVGRAEGVHLDDALIESVLQAPDKLGPAHRTSMAADLERGSRLEVDAVQGEIARRGAKLGVPTPAVDVAYAVIKLADDRAAVGR